MVFIITFLHCEQLKYIFKKTYIKYRQLSVYEKAQFMIEFDENS